MFFIPVRIYAHFFPPIWIGPWGATYSLQIAVWWKGLIQFKNKNNQIIRHNNSFSHFIVRRNCALCLYQIISPVKCRTITDRNAVHSHFFLHAKYSRSNWMMCGAISFRPKFNKCHWRESAGIFFVIPNRIRAQLHFLFCLYNLPIVDHVPSI